MPSNIKFASKCTFSCGLLSPRNNNNISAGIASSIMANCLGVIGIAYFFYKLSIVIQVSIFIQLLCHKQVILVKPSLDKLLPAQVTKKHAKRLFIQFTYIVLIKSDKLNDLGNLHIRQNKRRSKVSAAPLKGQASFMSSAGRRPARWHIPIQEHTGSGLQDARAEINTL